MRNNSSNSRNRNSSPRTDVPRASVPRTDAPHADIHRTDSPIRFRNAIQRDDAIGALLDALDLGEMWGDDGPTPAGYALASKSYFDTPDPVVVIMRAMCRLYQRHGGRNCPRNPNIDVIRIWELPSKALSLFGSLMVAMSGGYDDVDDWMDMVSPPDEEEDGDGGNGSNNGESGGVTGKESDCNNGEGGDRESA